jgi:chlorophyllide a reductase subunit Y
MGAAGAASLPMVINAALGNKTRFEAMREFFEGVGSSGDLSGVWPSKPEAHQEFRERYQAKLAKAAAKRKSQEMV